MTIDFFKLINTKIMTVDDTPVFQPGCNRSNLGDCRLYCHDLAL